MINCSSRKVNGERHSYYWGLKILRPEDMWFCASVNEWRDIMNCCGLSCSTHKLIKSLKAAKAHLRRHKELPRGTVAVLVGDNVEVILRKH